MQVALYGATGNAGSKILTELLSRGHHVTAIVRNPDKLAPQPNLTIVQGDVSSTTEIASKIKGAEAVVTAYAPPADDTDQVVAVTDRFIDALKGTETRFIVVGGAGSLEVTPGVTLRDSGHVPADWLPIVDSHIKVLALVRASSINWTYFSPAAFFVPGEATGKFRLGTDQLIADESKDSRITTGDYAIALVDELENPHHLRQRFTIGY